MSKRLLETNDFQMLKIDEKELSVQGKFDLYELFQRGGPQSIWEKNGKQSRAILLADDTWLFRIPSREAGAPVWLKMKQKKDANNLMEFYKNGDGNGGPARKFAQGGQSAPVPYTLFEQNWKVVDIGTLSISTSDESDNMRDADRLYFVTSTNESGQWLLYLDSRHGEARGCGGAFIGEAFNPDVDIQSSL